MPAHDSTCSFPIDVTNGNIPPLPAIGDSQLIEF